jgi:nucleotide-binding universal stress UspA family protein
MSTYTAKTVVVPVDFSDESLAAIDTALQAAESSSGVHVVHVIPEINIAEPGVIWQEIDNESRSQHAREALHQRLSDPKYEDIQIDIEIGDPGYRIADFAKRIGANLIVIPSHGRTGLAHMLLGSVTERVLRSSHCPVLVLRT